MQSILRTRSRRSRRAGQALVMVSVGVTFLLALGALAVDTVLIYAVRTRLSTAVDAASLAGARALGRGTTDEDQATEIERVANLLFKGNFPNGLLFTGSSGRIHSAIRVASKDQPESGSDMFESDPNLEPGVREVRINVEAVVPTFFAKVFGIPSVRVSASASAARRDTNVVLVLDRSASLRSANAWDDVQRAAVDFMSQFDNNRDKLGVVTFGSNGNVDLPVDTGFKTNDVGANTINVQTVPQSASTNAGLGMWLGYAELLRVNDADALNVIVFFTDGQPSSYPGKFRVRRQWERYYSSDPYCNSDYKTGTLGALQNTSVWNSPQFYDMWGLWGLEAGPAPVRGGADDRDYSQVSGCYGIDHNGDSVERMLYAGANLPDRFEAEYAGIERDFCIDNNPSSTCLGTDGDFPYYTNDSRFWSDSSYSSNSYFRGGNIHNGAKNLMLNVAQTARQDSSLGGVQIFTIGLGGFGYDADAALLKRVSNDPTNNYGVTIQTADDEPDGLYVYAPSLDDLRSAFNRVRSFVFRLTL